jgi:hypothetical protein
MEKEQIEQVEEKAPKYKPKQGEEKFVIVEIEQKQFSQLTGEKLSKPRIQFYNPKEWIGMEASLKSHGYTVTILHKPKD